MGWFIGGCVLLLIGVVALVIYAKTDPGTRHDDDVRGVSVVVGGASLLLAAVIIFLTLFSIVPARNVGIVVTFGKADRSVDNGWTWTAPWSTVELVDATTQTVTRDLDTSNPVLVRLGNQTTASVDVTVQWHIDPSSANELWQRYRGNNDDLIGNIRSKVIERQLIPAVNRAFEGHDPLGDAVAGKDAGLSNKDASGIVFSDLKSTVDRGIVIEAAVVQFVHYDQVTQDKLNAYAQALADTRLASQRVLTAEQQRLANEKLATSGSSTNPGVLYLACLNMVQELAAKNQLGNLPAAFTCSQEPTPVIVQKK